jgi:hypothetical protein
MPPRFQVVQGTRLEIEQGALGRGRHRYRLGKVQIQSLYILHLFAVLAGVFF